MADRRVSLLLVDRAGAFLGVLPEFEVGVPWWPETECVQACARSRYGADVTVVRVVDTSETQMPGGRVTYLAEVYGERPPVLLPPVAADLVAAKVREDQPNRMWWARPGGVAWAVAWAEGVLRSLGREVVAPVVQVKTWNLSLVLRLPTASGDVWLKATPPFMRHEGAAIELVASMRAGLVPTLLGREPELGVVLMADLPGEDRWDSDPAERADMVRRLVALESDWVDRVDALTEAGLPSAPLARLADDVADVLSRAEVRAALSSSAELGRLERALDLLPARVAQVDACGLPDTLVHGDFHPGNWRGSAREAVLLDWGDSHVGHPMMDVARMLEWRPVPGQSGLVRSAAVAAWREAAPGSDPARALDLVEPLADLRGAVVYQGFLDGIEDDERRYHAADPADCLRRAAADHQLQE